MLEQLKNAKWYGGETFFKVKMKVGADCDLIKNVFIAKNLHLFFNLIISRIISMIDFLKFNVALD